MQRSEMSGLTKSPSNNPQPNNPQNKTINVNREGDKDRCEVKFSQTTSYEMKFETKNRDNSPLWGNQFEGGHTRPHEEAYYEPRLNPFQDPQNKGPAAPISGSIGAIAHKVSDNAFKAYEELKKNSPSTVKVEHIFKNSPRAGAGGLIGGYVAKKTYDKIKNQDE